MSFRQILSYPDERLRVVAQSVTAFDKDLATLVDDMFETMYHERGIGLAATQIGDPRCVAVMDITENKDSPLCLVNPKITRRAGEETMTEGCLSVPNFTAEVARARAVSIEAFDREGAVITLEADGLLAICIQHELDHLQGKLFIDYLSSLRRERF